MLQKDCSAILLQDNNVLAFCTYSTISANDEIPIFGCYNYANELESLINLKKKQSLRESIGNIFTGGKKKTASHS